MADEATEARAAEIRHALRASGHGSPADRGAADSYYRRGRNPHYWPEGTHIGKRVVPPQMTREQVAEYDAAYDRNEAEFNWKEWD